MTNTKENVTKAKLIELIESKRTGDTESSKEILELVLGTIKEAILNGQKVSLAGLGVFTHVNKKERIIVTPKSEKAVTVKAHVTPRFKLSKKLQNEYLRVQS